MHQILDNILNASKTNIWNAYKVTYATVWCYNLVLDKYVTITVWCITLAFKNICNWVCIEREIIITVKKIAKIW